MSPRLFFSAAEMAAKLSTGEITQTISFSPLDFILYALSVGAEDVVRRNAADLPFVFEDFSAAKDGAQGSAKAKFSILPTFFTTPSFRTTWRRSLFTLPPTAVPPTLVHSAQRLILHPPLPEPIVGQRLNGGAFPNPPLNSFKSTARLLDVTERPGGKGLTTVTRTDTFAVTPEGERLVCTNYSTGLIIAPGLEGIGRKVLKNAPADPLARITDDRLLKDYGGLLGIPTHLEPTHTLTFRTHPFQATLHRLVAHDDNPIHISPAGAHEAGFPGPILHGLGTFGILGKMVTDACANGDGSRLRSLNARFAGVVIPGDELVVRVWDPTVDGGKPKLRSGSPPTAYKPGARRYRRALADTGRIVKIVVFEAAVVENGKERFVVRDGQAEIWEDGTAGEGTGEARL